MLSNAYRMSVRFDPAAYAEDPENRLLWRMNRRRLEVEAIRDGMLAVAGTLDRTVGGSLLATPNFAYVTNDQSKNAAQYDAPRRSIYLPVIRNAVYDAFQVFDFVEPSLTNGKRATTTVAPQALFLLNSDLVLRQSRALANELLSATGAGDSARVRVAYLKSYGRPPSEAETADALDYLTRYERDVARVEQDGSKRRLLAWQSFCQVLFAASEFIYVN